MDFNKIKDFAKTATEKAKGGIAKANEIRIKAGQETKITLPASNQFTQPVTVRKTVEGEYYLGIYSEIAEKFEFVGFKFDGSKVIERTTGTTTQSSNAGKALLGGLVNGHVGAVIGSAGKRKGTINTTTVQEEKPGKATIELRSLTTGQIKSIKTKLTQSQANNVLNFFD